jgi:hypothetical protein
MTTSKLKPISPSEPKLYYIADTGHFGIKVKVCFSEPAFQQAVKDSKITTKHHALDVGLAESHYIQQEGTTHAMLAIVFNYEEMAKLDALERIGIIYHEVSHTTTHVFEYIGEEETKVGDESRSYLGEHIFKQVFSIYATEDDTRERIRKGNRVVSDQTSEKVLGALLQMAEHNNGGTRSNSVSKPKGTSSRAKDPNRGNKSKTNSRIRRAG